MKVIGALALIFTLVLAVGVNAFEYQVPYYDDSIDGNNVETDPVSFSSENGDNTILSQTLGFHVIAVPNTNYTATYESPFSVVNAISSGGINTNASCLDIGTATKTFVKLVEGRNTITHDGSGSNFISTMNRINVTTISRYLNITNDDSDTEGFAYNMFFTEGTYASATPTSANIITNLNSGNYGLCERLTVKHNTTPTIAVGTGNSRYFSYMIFNSTAGNVSWYARETLVSSGSGIRMIIYRLSDSSIVDSYTSTGSSTYTWSDSAILEQNQLYVLGIGWETGSMATIPTPYMKVLVDVGLPDYDCEDWSECIDGSQNRQCVDLNGFQPNLIETRSCSLIILENVTFGFENVTTINYIDVCEPTWLFGCGYTIKNDVEVDIPQGWTIEYAHNWTPYRQDYFLQMTSDWATDGTRSLKMWVIPPALGEPSNIAFTCINLTSARYPTVYKPINDTFILSFNVTFPAENMLLSYDVKSCTGQVLKHSALGGVVWSTNETTGEPIYLIPPLCPKTCYAESCDTKPKSDYVFNIQDTSTSKSIIGNPFYSTGRDLATSVSFPLEGVTVGVNYNIVFGSIPENVFDRSGQCIMFDNVRYEVIEDPITTTLVPDCTSKCIGNDYYLATKLSNGECSLAILKDDYNCIDPIIAEKIANLENYCLDDNTLRIFIPKAGQYQNSLCDTNEICIENSCVDQTEYEEELLTSLYAPLPIIQAILNEWFIPYSGNEIVWFYNSVFMYVNYLALGLAFGVSLVVRGNAKEPKDMYIPFIVTIIIILVGSTFGGFYPLEVGLPIIVFIGVILWKTSEGIVGGRSRGGG